MIAFIISLFISAPAPLARVEPLEAEVDALWAPEGATAVVAIPADPDQRAFKVGG